MWKCLKDEYYLKFDPRHFLYIYVYICIFSKYEKHVCSALKKRGGGGKVFNLLFQNFTLKLQVEFPLFKFNFFVLEKASKVGGRFPCKMLQTHLTDCNIRETLERWVGGEVFFLAIMNLPEWSPDGEMIAAIGENHPRC